MGRETLRDDGPLHQLSINFGLDDRILIWYQRMLYRAGSVKSSLIKGQAFKGNGLIGIGCQFVPRIKKRMLLRSVDFIRSVLMVSYAATLKFLDKNLVEFH
ncbi:unnamed protein product [Prunus armeniaca]